MKKCLMSIFTLFTGICLLCPSAEAQPGQKVDIFLLFDDTGSFSTFAPSVRDIFSGLADDLEAALPGVDLAFGVGRFKDFGGPGWDFCSNRSEHCVDDFPRRVNGRPFYLNQPIITSAVAGGRQQRDALIVEALNRSAPGTGGDDPESHIEALWQIVGGAGFDGNGDGGLNGSDGTQIAGNNATQVTPDQSGDVPPFTSLQSGVAAAGNIGGAGFRPDALKLVIIATEICAAIPFKAGSAIPAKISGRYSEESIADFACLSTTAGDDRFGFVSNAKTAAANSVTNAVVPTGAADFLGTIAALNAADVRVLAMGPKLAPLEAGSGPGHEPSGFLSALARITGGVDPQGTPLVFDTGAGGAFLRDRLAQAIVSAAIVNPGCTLQDLSPFSASVADSLNKQRAMALKLIKKSKSKSAYKKASAQIKKLHDKAQEALGALPGQTSVCGNNACPAVDHSATLQLLGETSRSLDRTIGSAIKAIQKKAGNTSKAKKQSKKQKASASTLRTQNSSGLSNMPNHTNNCS